MDHVHSLRPPHPHPQSETKGFVPRIGFGWFTQQTQIPTLLLKQDVMAGLKHHIMAHWEVH